MIQSSESKEILKSENGIVTATNGSESTPSKILPTTERGRPSEIPSEDVHRKLKDMVRNKPHGTGNGTSSLSVKTTPNVQDTSYRIQHTSDVSSNSSLTKNSNPINFKSTKVHTEFENQDIKNDKDEPLTTTFHFASGLTLPISSSTMSNKQMIANAGRNANAGMKSNTLRPYPQSGVVYKGDSGDVHELLNFSALRDPSHNVEATQAEDAKKKKLAQEKILESKKSAARAMLGIQPTLKGNDYRILKHLRIQLESVSNIENCITNEHEGKTVRIAFDPDYLFMTHDMGIQFLKDVYAVIQDEISKLNDASSSSGYKSRFLQDSMSQQKDTSMQSIGLIPQWLQPCLKTKDSEVSLLLTILGRIENAVLQAYDIMNGMNPNSPLLFNSGVPESQQKMLTPPTTPLLKSSRISLDGSVDCFHTPREFESLEGNGSQKVTPDGKLNSTYDIPAVLSKLTNERSSYLRNLFKSRDAMALKPSTKENFDIQTRLSTELKINDLLLVPVGAQCFENDTSNSEKLKEMIGIWNSIISSAAKLINYSACTDGTEYLEFSGDGEVFELFADDGFDANATKKKKKKKKNKKKVCLIFIYDHNEKSSILI
jgi:hypothetical protein